MATSRRVTIIGDDADGYTWSCGTCGAGASQTSATRDLALADFDVHYNTAPNVAVDQWLLDTLTAAKALYQAAAPYTDLSTQIAALKAAVASGPPGILATWRNGGITHPQ